MTLAEKEKLEMEVLYEHEKAEREYEAHRIKLERMGEKLAELGKALQEYPELITPTPEIDGPDLREGLNLLNRQEIIDLCKQAKQLKEKQEKTARRKVSLGL